MKCLSTLVHTPVMCALHNMDAKGPCILLWGLKQTHSDWLARAAPDMLAPLMCSLYDLWDLASFVQVDDQSHECGLAGYKSSCAALDTALCLQEWNVLQQRVGRSG